MTTFETLAQDEGTVMFYCLVLCPQSVALWYKDFDERLKPHGAGNYDPHEVIPELRYLHCLTQTRSAWRRSCGGMAGSNYNPLCLTLQGYN
ncbi:hypothetical protein V5799_006971 [Amblyomma americanum]|uniref:Uncharacterized protein n=1 Tax=Amblyomma americanum TaxID=6943 RepID=A0AAQ4DUW2_AMBAM